MQGRSPYLLETSLPGVFAVGDVRANSVKRVAAAVGEGSMSVRLSPSQPQPVPRGCFASTIRWSSGDQPAQVPG